MIVHYKNKRLENILIAVNVLIAGFVAASFVMLFGFDEPLLPRYILYTLQAVLLCVFIFEKLLRVFNSFSIKEFLQANWFEIPLFIALILAIFGAGRWFARDDYAIIRQVAIGLYLVLQVVIKVCRTVVKLAASGKNPMQTLIASFLVLILVGAGLLTLPRASVPGSRASVVDSIFTATSAVCVTGLIVRDTGQDFSLMGQVIILSLIQLGGLGIVVFGAVLALLLGQALSLSESVAMQDMLNARTLSQIGKMIVFIFITTILIEAIGALTMLGMWDNVPGQVTNIHQQWYYSIFHSISAFCNAGFCLFSDSFIGYNKSPNIYAVICPLIILGGLGFGVLYDLVNIAIDRVKGFFKWQFNKQYRMARQAPKRMHLQSKIVLSVSVLLIVLGAAAIYMLEHYSVGGNGNTSILGALFQSITARTAGFNTINIAEMSTSSRFVLILLMFVGGSPGSTAGGIKTVTLAVIVISAVATLRKRPEVEMFSRSVRLVVVGRAITIMLLFVAVLFTASLALSFTEAGNESTTMSDIFFEAASALGTVGLSTGITSSLTTAGKLIIVMVMLIGRLGPLTLLAALTFNLKPARYNYPQEAVIVG